MKNQPFTPGQKAILDYIKLHGPTATLGFVRAKLLGSIAHQLYVLNVLEIGPQGYQFPAPKPEIDRAAIGALANSPEVKKRNELYQQRETNIKKLLPRAYQVGPETKAILLAIAPELSLATCSLVASRLRPNRGCYAVAFYDAEKMLKEAGILGMARYCNRVRQQPCCACTACRQSHKLNRESTVGPSTE